MRPRQNKSPLMNIPNAITAFRIAVVLVAAYSVLGQFGESGKSAAPFMIAAAFLLDSLDGFVARKLSQVSEFGSALDIAGDRIAENVLLLTFAAIGILPIAIPIIFLVRGFLVDTFRWERRETFSKKAPFWKGVFVTSKFSRGLYGIVKGAAFILLAYSASYGTAFVSGAWIRFFAVSLAWIAAALCVARGLASLPWSKGA